MPDPIKKQDIPWDKLHAWVREASFVEPNHVQRKRGLLIWDRTLKKYLPNRSVK